MKFYLLRHAESVANEKGISDSIIDSELSEKGRKAAEGLVTRLSKDSYDLFIVSPLKRTIGTVQPFLNTIEKPVVVVEPLTIERDIGEFVGTPRGVFTKYCESNNFDKIYCKSDRGESIEDVYKRAEKFLTKITKKYKNKSILVCGHKVFLHCLALVFDGASVDEYYQHERPVNGEVKEFTI